MSKNWTTAEVTFEKSNINKHHVSPLEFSYTWEHWISAENGPPNLAFEALRAPPRWRAVPGRAPNCWHRPDSPLCPKHRHLKGPVRPDSWCILRCPPEIKNASKWSPSLKTEAVSGRNQKTEHEFFGWNQQIFGWKNPVDHMFLTKKITENFHLQGFGYDFHLQHPLKWILTAGSSAVGVVQVSGVTAVSQVYYFIIYKCLMSISLKASIYVESLTIYINIRIIHDLCVYVYICLQYVF